MLSGYAAWLVSAHSRGQAERRSCTDRPEPGRGRGKGSVPLKALCIACRIFEPMPRCASETVCASTVLPPAKTIGQEIYRSAYSLRIGSVCLDNVSFFTPPVAGRNPEGASSLQQRHDDASWSYEAGRKTSPGNDGPDRSGGAASTVSSCPGTPESCASPSQQGQGKKALDRLYSL